MRNKRVTEIGSSKNKLEGNTLQPTIDDLICKETSFLKLTKDDFEFVEVVAPSSITEPEVTSMEANDTKNYFYELTPKLDWINDVNDFEKLGYNLKFKSEDEEAIIKARGMFDVSIQDNVIIATDGASVLINNGKLDDEENFVEKNCFYIGLMNILNTVIDFELELFKIDSIPTIYSYEDIGYSLVIGKDGKLYKCPETN